MAVWMSSPVIIDSPRLVLCHSHFHFPFPLPVPCLLIFLVAPFSSHISYTIVSSLTSSPCSFINFLKVNSYITANHSDYIRGFTWRWGDHCKVTDLDVDHWHGRWGVIWVAVFWLLIFILMAGDATWDVSKEVRSGCSIKDHPSCFWAQKKIVVVSLNS